MRLHRIGVGLALGAALLGRAAVAQQNDPWDFRSRGITRAQLTAILARYDAASRSPAYSDALRATVVAQGDSIRARLRDGDLRIGDRVRLVVEGQPTLTDTFTVSVGPALILPAIGPVQLGGVLRSELDSALADGVDRVYRGAVVRARLLTRVAVLGGVARSGFYALPGEALVEDAITAAGGLAGNVQLRDIYIERGRTRLWAPDSLQVAMTARRTLSDLGVEDGDRIIVPAPRPPQDPMRTVQVLSYLSNLPLTIVALLRIL